MVREMAVMMLGIMRASIWIENPSTNNCQAIVSTRIENPPTRDCVAIASTLINPIRFFPDTL